VEDDDARIPVTQDVDFGAARLMPDVDRPGGWLLTVDGAPQSYVDLDDPTYLEFEYARRLAYVLDAAAPEGEPLEIVHLGGGALTLPRYAAVTRPGSRQQVVEADRALAALVAARLPMGRDGDGVAIATDDARVWLEGARDASADVVVADVFGGSRVPAHLTSYEFVTEAARVLRPGGLYLANLADSAPFDFLRPQIAGLREVFGEVCLIAEPGVLRGRRFGNTVLAASRAPLPVEHIAWRTASDVFPARVVDGDALEVFRRGARPVYDKDAVPSPIPPDGSFGVG
jgi:spermidine synthase